jgi:hypothetical protein
VIACGGIGVGDAIAVGESVEATTGASGEADPLGAGMGDGVVVGEVVGSGVGDSVGAGESVGSGEAVSMGASTVPKIGAKRSSANERGVTINTQSRTRAKMAFFIVDSGALAMLARVMKMAQTIIFGRVLPEQIESLARVPW